MPLWLHEQLKKAYLAKNRVKIQLLNECWYYYVNRHRKQKSSEQIS